MAHQEQRRFYLKAYVLWWAAMALLGSLFLNGPSKSFPDWLYHPVAWNTAGILALLIATWHTHYRAKIKHFFDHPLMVRAYWMLFWAGQWFTTWERYQKKPDVVVVIILSIMTLFVICLSLNFVNAVYRTVRKS